MSASCYGILSRQNFSRLLSDRGSQIRSLVLSVTRKSLGVEMDVIEQVL